MTHSNGLKALLKRDDHVPIRYSYYVSVVLTAPQKDGVGVGELLRGQVRGCDELYVLDEGVAVVMPHTSARSAERAIDRYRRSFGELVDIQHAISRTPEDAPWMEMVAAAKGRRHEGSHEEFGEAILRR